MSEPGWAEVLAEHHVEESAVERSARLARQAADAQDRAEVLAEAERAAAVEDERDRRLFSYQQLGIGGRSVADLAADASRAAEEDDQYNEAVRTIDRIEKRRAARREAARSQAEQVAAVSRAQIPADPLEAAQREAHRAFRAATRAQINQAMSGQPVSRPKDVVRSRGGAVRSEGPVTCSDCQEAGVKNAGEEYEVHQLMAENAAKADHLRDLETFPVSTLRNGTGHGPMIFR